MPTYEEKSGPTRSRTKPLPITWTGRTRRRPPPPPPGADPAVEPLDVFMIHVRAKLGWWERVKVLFGLELSVDIEMPVWLCEHGLTGKAESKVRVASIGILHSNIAMVGAEVRQPRPWPRHLPRPTGLPRPPPPPPPPPESDPGVGITEGWT